MSDQVGNFEDAFSHNEAHKKSSFLKGYNSLPMYDSMVSASCLLTTGVCLIFYLMENPVGKSYSA